MEQVQTCAGSGSEPSASVTARRPLTVSARVIIALDRGIYRVSKRWLFLLNSTSFVYVLTLFLAPVFVAAGYDRLAQPIYSFNGLFCHQQSDRSFHLFGEKMACCERCAAIYGAILLVGLFFTFWRNSIGKPRIVDVAVLSLPMVIDGGAQLAGLWESTAATRVLTGGMFGAALCWFLLPYFESGFSRIREQIEALFARLVQEGRATPLR